MKRKKLLAALSDLLHKKQRRKRKHQAELKKLLRKLKKKEIQLEEKMLMEKEAQKRKRMEKELQIVRAQLAKGLETLQDLELT